MQRWALFAADSAHMLVSVMRQVSEVRYIHVKDLLDHWHRDDPTFVGISGDDAVSVFLANPCKKPSNNSVRQMMRKTAGTADEAMCRAVSCGRGLQGG
jgi:hypothetical protein